MTTWKINLLGQPYAQANGTFVHLGTKKMWGVLVSLLLAPENQLPRRVLMNRFWPRATDTQSLRQALTGIRYAFQPQRCANREECARGKRCPKLNECAGLEAFVLLDGDPVRLDGDRFELDLDQIDAWQRKAAETPNLDERIYLLWTCDVRELRHQRLPYPHR